MAERMILVFDLGTTYLKSVLFDQAGHVLALDRAPLPIEHPQPGWWEVSVEVFLAAVCAAAQRLAASQPEGLADVQAVSFATQTNSFVLLGSDDQPLTPLLLWPDMRAETLGDDLAALATPAEWPEIAGRPAPSPQLVVAKLLWLQRRQPDLWKATRRFCLISDYLTLWLTGEHATEIGAMAFTSLMDIRSGGWWRDMHQRLSVEPHILPRIVRAATDLGTVRAEAAAKLGLPAGCRFVVGAFDQHAGAIGVGNSQPGSASETTGTVLVTVRCSDNISQRPADIYQGPGHAVGLYFQLAVSETSANLLEWYRNQLPDRPTFEVLSTLAAASPPGELRLRRGVIHPKSVADLFEGSPRDLSRGQIVRGIMEGVARELRGRVRDLWGPDCPALIRAAGGAARSDLWLQIKADMTGMPVAATDCPEPTSLGAAMLAAHGLEWTTMQESRQHWVHQRRVFEPLPLRGRCTAG